MDAVPNLTAAGIREVQQTLAKKGFDPGPIDGILGAQTEQAIRKFQEYYGIKVSGRIDNQTLYALGDLYHHPIEIEHPSWHVRWADPATTLASRRALASLKK